MATDSSDSFSVRFDGNNYAIWSFHFRFFIEGKDLVDYLNGTAKKPTADASTAAQKTWKTNNARVFSWLLGSVDQNIALTLRTFDCAATVWDHLKKTYSQVNHSRVFEVEYELAKLTQGELDVRYFYNVAAQLWTEQDLISTSILDTAVNEGMKKERQRSRILQFLIKLRLEFESVRSQLISANTTDVDTILGDLFRAETRLKTQANLDGNQVDGGSVFAVHRGSAGRPQFNFQSFSNHSPAAQTHSSSGGEVRCHHCNEIGHFRNHCKKTELLYLL
ncbi:Retrovirus-related Pol polyprotein from transposon RE1 [Linum grandiflorum]